jgi:hypothetical protein
MAWRGAAGGQSWLGPPCEPPNLEPSRPHPTRRTPRARLHLPSARQVSRNLIGVLRHVPRVAWPPTERQRREAAERGEAPAAAAPSFYNALAADDDTTVRAIINITTGITGVSEPVQVGWPG